ncbi:MAG: class I SAM-dependent methyltransferase [Candidatus Heimdallarchaeum endolithica]|uniref:Class I SAM-dependent methyltransferase n=1 Tax=Candidatus Heimdallarchaeum endolithica TaxID=2876572 RepID=A0A9Y1BST8_9ARCH|nr:MAG: class I SAM-dependent methyltransferase [Candidatus Heimdallarchaeum endolithica]
MNSNKEFMETNKKRWNELVEIHSKSKSYDLEGFLKGKNSLHSVEHELLGDIKGKKILHLQCHFGMDTLSLARMGAEVTGVDFSEKAIDFAKKLSEQINVRAKFVCANIYDPDKLLNEKFDFVFTTYGVLPWLPDIKKWAEVISKFLRKGGQFLIVESHPLSHVFDDENEKELKIRYSYFSKEAMEFDSEYTYTDSDKKIEHLKTYEWMHTISEILNSLIAEGLKIKLFNEYPFSEFKQFPFLEQYEDGYWHFKDKKIDFPLLFALKAVKE